MLHSLLFLSLSTCIKSFRLPVKSFSAINRSKTLRYTSDINVNTYLSNINVNSKIIELEAELKKLKEVLRSATGEEKLLYLQLIVVKEQQLIIWIDRLPKPGKNQSSKLDLLHLIYLRSISF